MIKDIAVVVDGRTRSAGLMLSKNPVVIGGSGCER
jgi:hypothetical protein